MVRRMNHILTVITYYKEEQLEMQAMRVSLTENGEAVAIEILKDGKRIGFTPLVVDWDEKLNARENAK